MKGTQTVDRAINLLKLIADHHPQGVLLGEIAELQELDRATAYRLATSLVEAGLVERDAAKVYRLGVGSMLLGLASMRAAPILNQVRPMMLRLARLSEDTVFLVVRNGDYGQCVHCEQGAYPIKALVLRVGGMRVLGIGSAGTTLLSLLPDSEIASLHARHRDEFASRNRSLTQVMRLVAQTRARGFATTDDLITEGVSGVAMSFEFSQGGHAAVSIAAIRSRMTPERRLWIAQLMAKEFTGAGLIPFSFRSGETLPLRSRR